MAQILLAGWDSFIDTYINTNGANSITGALLNQALHYISDTLLWAKQRRAKGLVVASGANTVTFKDDAGVADPFNSNDYVALPGIRVYDASGNNIDFQVTSLTYTGFTLTSADAGFVDYVAVETGQSGA